MIDIDGLHAYRAKLDRDKASTLVDWPIPPETREACWRVLAETVDGLIALGPDAPDAASADVLRRGVVAYDDLNDGFLTKPEREDLCRVLYEIGALAGMDAGDEWVEAWRGW